MARTSKSSKPKSKTSSKPAPRKPTPPPVMRTDNHSGMPMVKGDDWNNALTGFGIEGIDKRKSMQYNRTLILDEVTLDDLYRGDGFAKRIVELPTGEMMRRGFELKGDEDRKIRGILEKKGIHTGVENLIRWAGLFGGSLGVLGLQDGLDLDKPVNEKGIKSLEFMHVFDRWRVSWTSADLYNDAKNPKYGKPQYYNVSPVDGTRPFRVHETRTVRLDGLPVSDRARIENMGWGDSKIQVAFEQLRALVSIYGSAEMIMDDFITGVLGMKNLSDYLAAGNKNFLKDRIAGMDLSKSILNTTVIDAEFETYEKKASSVAGVPDIIDRFAMWLSGVTGIPQTLLMGQSPAGLNATGESDIRGWYDSISQEQKKKLSPIYERILYLIFISKEGGGEPEDWEIQWLPLWEPTDAEKATTGKAEAETMDLYVQMGAMDPGEVREVIRERYNLEGDAPEPEPPVKEDPIPPPANNKPAGAA